MADTYSDFDTQKMRKLENEVNDLLDEHGEIWGYDIARNHIDWDNIGWTQSTGEKALYHLRKKWDDDGYITVTTEQDGMVERKKWVKNPDTTGA